MIEIHWSPIVDLLWWTTLERVERCQAGISRGNLSQQVQASDVTAQSGSTFSLSLPTLHVVFVVFSMGFSFMFSCVSSEVQTSSFFFKKKSNTDCMSNPFVDSWSWELSKCRVSRPDFAKKQSAPTPSPFQTCRFSSILKKWDLRQDKIVLVGMNCE